MTQSIKQNLIDQEVNFTEKVGKILVVDDDPLIRKALTLTLQYEGFKVEIAQNGEEALKQIKKDPPALIICDQTLPGMNGIEILQKCQLSHPEITRILLTGSHDLETAIQAINFGDVYRYITKPWEDRELKTIVKQGIEKYKRIIEEQLLRRMIATQNAKLSAAHKNLKKEIALSAKIHSELLIGKTPQKIPGMTLEALSKPSKEIDGDFFEFYQPLDNIFDLVLGDVMGKGISAALVGTAVKSQLIRFALPFSNAQQYTKTFGWNNHLLSPTEILSCVHEEIEQKISDLGYFVSLFYGRFNLDTHTFSYVDCGAAKPLVFRNNRSRVETLEGKNFPLGMHPQSEYYLKEVPFSPGDLFLFYSDGVSEARTLDNQLFGVGKVIEIVQSSPNLAPSELLDLIKDSVIKFTGQEKLSDDLTLILIQCEEEDLSSYSQYERVLFSSDLSELKQLRPFVRAFCQKTAKSSEKFCNEMELVLNEAFCNIVEHGYLKGANKKIQLFAATDDEGVLFQLSDQGLPFDPSKLKEPSFDKKGARGYGWYIIRKLSDMITYERKKNSRGWNHLSLYKKYTDDEETHGHHTSTCR